jgi:hypothetical protein
VQLSGTTIEPTFLKEGLNLKVEVFWAKNGAGVLN